MPTRTKITLGGLIAALLLAAAVSTASARRFEVSEQRFLANFPELNYHNEVEVICNLTIEGSFHSKTISKVSGALIGYITEAAFAHPCTQNEAWTLNGIERPTEGTSPNTLPWHVSYVSFTGALPRITRIRVSVVGYSYVQNVGGLICLFSATTANPEFFEFELNTEGRVTALRFEERTRILKHSGSILCASEIFFSGTARVGRGPEREWREISVRLVA